ncbi:MAG: hypothetical protein RR381_00640 [Raoultibacter sp.]
MLDYLSSLVAFVQALYAKLAVRSGPRFVGYFVIVLVCCGLLIWLFLFSGYREPAEFVYTQF